MILQTEVAIGGAFFHCVLIASESGRLLERVVPEGAFFDCILIALESGRLPARISLAVSLSISLLSLKNPDSTRQPVKLTFGRANHRNSVRRTRNLEPKWLEPKWLEPKRLQPKLIEPEWLEPKWIRNRNICGCARLRIEIR